MSFRKPDGDTIFFTVMLSIALLAIIIGIGCSSVESVTARTVILHDDSGTSYACTVSKADTNPHDCKPIKDTK